MPHSTNQQREANVLFNALQFWKNISDNDFAVDLKKFRSNYFDCIIGKFTPASLKQILDVIHVILSPM